MTLVLRCQDTVKLQRPAGGTGALGRYHQHSAATLNFAHGARRVVVKNVAELRTTFVLDAVDVRVTLVAFLRVGSELGVRGEAQEVDAAAAVVPALGHPTCVRSHEKEYCMPIEHTDFLDVR